MKQLRRSLQGLFSAARPHAKDVHRRARERAVALAGQCGAEIERLRDSGFNVWPPAGLAADPFDGDHFAQDWAEVLDIVTTYAAAVATPQTQRADRRDQPT